MFVIGNSWGWSTLALALLNPEAKVVAIDSGFDNNSLEGLEFTSRLAREETLNVRAINASSPHDVPAVLAAEFDAPIEFAFIDGYHTQQQVALDFFAIRPSAAPDAVCLFHDVLEFHLSPGIEHASAASGLPWFMLDGTPSGMAALFDPARQSEVSLAIGPFRGSGAVKAIMADEAYKATHRRRLKWRRRLNKSIKQVRRLVGAD